MRYQFCFCAQIKHVYTVDGYLAIDSLSTYFIMAAIITPLVSFIIADAILIHDNTEKYVQATIVTFFIWIFLIIVFLIASFEGKEILLALRNVSIVCIVIIIATIGSTTWYFKSRTKIKN